MRNPAGSKTAASHAVDYSTASALERPVPTPVSGPKFGSDAVAEALRALDIPYIAINPGASFRGLHDSLVNYLGNQRPSIGRVWTALRWQVAFWSSAFCWL